MDKIHTTSPPGRKNCIALGPSLPNEYKHILLGLGPSGMYNESTVTVWVIHSSAHEAQAYLYRYRYIQLHSEGKLCPKLHMPRSFIVPENSSSDNHGAGYYYILQLCLSISSVPTPQLVKDRYTFQCKVLCTLR